MQSTILIHTPINESEWASLSAICNEGKSNNLLNALMECFRIRGCISILEENAYIDRDFSAAFSAFYSSLFKPLSKFCRRLHFFASDVSALKNFETAREIIDFLQSVKSDYLGDVILRPLPHAPVSSARLSATKLVDATKQNVSVRSHYHNHILGVDFDVEAMPLTQQDTRTGACAQASIWMAGRHFYNRHSASWFSMPDITNAALNPTSSGLTRSLPAGSEFLTPDNMVRALRAMGRHPVTYVPDGFLSSGLSWVNVSPKEVISRYIDSGIPVILGLQQSQTAIGHAVVAVGSERKETMDVTVLPDLPTTSEFYSHFLVNDDQRGAYCRLPIADVDKTGEYPFSLQSDIRFILVPLPSKVFMTAESAELVARDIVKSFTNNRIKYARQVLGEDTDWDEDTEFYNAVLSNSLVARTYLTYGWKYKERMLKNCCSQEMQAELLSTQLPKYVWVTEFSMPDVTAASLEPCKRLIRAHVVSDATGSIFWDSQLIVDVPGISVFRQYDPTAMNKDPKIVIRAFKEAAPYWPKIRGQMDYSIC